MSLALRPYVTAGVALVGASVIAVTPVAAPAPDVYLPVLSSHASVELSAFTNPLDTWASVLTASFTDVGALGQAIADNPAPILRQVIANQIANATKLAGIGQTVATNIGNLLDPNNPYGSVGYLQTAISQAAAGDVADAIGSIYSALIVAPAFQLGFPLLGMFDVVTAVATNFQKFVAVTPNLVVAAGMNFAFGTLGSINVALQDTAQGFVDAVKAGDVETAASLALNAPAVLAGAALNGYAPYDHGGLLGEDGPIRAFVDWQERAAEAIGKPKPPITFALQSAGMTAVPDASAAPAVALSTNPAPAEAASEATSKPDSATAPADSPATAPQAAPTAPTAPEVAAPEKVQAAGTPLVRDSLVATTGTTRTTSATSKPAAKVVSDVRDGISSTVNKIGEGVKKAFSKPATADTTKSDAGVSGSGKHRAGASSSGDAK